jgi:hypothetical protein
LQIGSRKIKPQQTKHHTSATTTLHEIKTHQKNDNNNFTLMCSCNLARSSPHIQREKIAKFWKQKRREFFWGVC